MAGVLHVNKLHEPFRQTTRATIFSRVHTPGVSNSVRRSGGVRRRLPSLRCGLSAFVGELSSRELRRSATLQSYFPSSCAGDLRDPKDPRDQKDLRDPWDLMDP